MIVLSVVCRLPFIYFYKIATGLLAKANKCIASCEQVYWIMSLSQVLVLYFDSHSPQTLDKTAILITLAVNCIVKGYCWHKLFMLINEWSPYVLHKDY